MPNPPSHPLNETLNAKNTALTNTIAATSPRLSRDFSDITSPMIDIRRTGAK